MAFTYGFYDSVSSDRLYTARQFGQLFDGLIYDGVYEDYGDHFEVVEDSGMNILIKSGRAWFKSTWSLNDSNLSDTVPTADPLLPRIDIVYLEINLGSGVRANKIDIVTGTPASSPVPPTLTQSGDVWQYPLAHIYVGAGVTTISDANITNKMGTVDCPYVTGPVSGNFADHDHTAGQGGNIGSTGISNSAIVETKIADGAVTVNKIGSLAVSTAKIQSSAISAAKIATSAVEEAKIATGAVTNTKLGSSAVSEAKIADGAVTLNKIATGAVGAGKIAVGGVSASSQIANDIITDAQIGDRVPILTRRQGGHTTYWKTPGTTNYTPTNVMIQVGSKEFTIDIGSYRDYLSVTFPVMFVGDPLVFCQVADTPYPGSFNYIIELVDLGYQNFGVWCTEIDHLTHTSAINVVMHWMAIGQPVS